MRFFRRIEDLTAQEAVIPRLPSIEAIDDILSVQNVVAFKDTQQKVQGLAQFLVHYRTGYRDVDPVLVESRLYAVGQKLGACIAQEYKPEGIAVAFSAMQWHARLFVGDGMLTELEASDSARAARVLEDGDALMVAVRSLQIAHGFATLGSHRYGDVEYSLQPNHFEGHYTGVVEETAAHYIAMFNAMHAQGRLPVTEN